MKTMQVILKTALDYFWLCLKILFASALIAAGILLAIIVPICLFFLPTYLGYSAWWILATGPFTLFVICVIAAFISQKNKTPEYNDWFLPK
jgi:hypothetical protein